MALTLTKIKQLEKRTEAKLGCDSDKMLPVPDRWEDFVRLTRIRSGNKILVFDPYTYQVRLSDCIDQHYGTIAVKSRQLGLTQTVASKFLHKACKNPAYTALVLSKNQDDTRRIAERIGEMIHCLGEYIRLTTDSKLHIRIENGGQIYFRNSTPDGARGIDSVSDVLFDEAAFVPEIDLIYTAVMPCLEMTGDEARVVVISTPNGRSGWFYDQLVRDNGNVDALEVCEQIKAKQVEPTQHWEDENGWCKFITHWLDHPKYSQKEDYLEDIQKKKKLSWAKTQQEYNLSFTDSEVAVFSAEIVQKCAVGCYENTRDDSAQYFIGIDPAFGGDDYCVGLVTKLKDGKLSVVALYRKRRQTNDYNIYHLSELIKKWKPTAIGIEINSGGRIYAEQLIKMNPDVEFKEFNTSENSKRVFIERLKLSLEQERFLFPSNCPLKEELLVFRREGKKMGAVAGKHDDTVTSAGSVVAVAESSGSGWNFDGIPRIKLNAEV